MKRIALLATGAAVATAVSAAILGTSTASTAKTQRHFTVVTHDSQGTITPPNFGSNPKQNQQASEDAPAYIGGKKVGRAETIITVTRVAPKDLEATIECTVELPKGKILFNGSFNFNRIGKGVKVPVVGGTGAYKGTSGTVEAQSTNPARTKLTFSLL
jgi:hypothetical protein